MRNLTDGAHLRGACDAQHVPDYEDKAFANASKEDLKLADKDEEEKKKDKVGA